MYNVPLSWYHEFICKQEKDENKQIIKQTSFSVSLCEMTFQAEARLKVLLLISCCSTHASRLTVTLLS